VSATHTLTDAELRRAPSPSSLAVLCAAIQPGGQVGAVRRLRGGIASGMHAVVLVGADGERRRVVVRRYGAWRLGRDPRVAEREWSTLAALARAGVPVPRPLWLDKGGVVFGCPTLVTSRLPGRGMLTSRDEADWVRQLAETLGRIHAAPLSASELEILLGQHADLADLLERDAPPPDLAKLPGIPEVWSAMRRWWPHLDGSVAALVHGDYWPGNTLWRYGRLTGVIDWEQARRGDPAQDVGCCRLDLALLAGPEASEAFRRAYEAATGRSVHHLFFWDLYMVTWALENLEHWISGYHDLGRTDITVEIARDRLARFTAAALADAERGPGAP
jgi:aminoglycoside phosphotransferase (APT) family kinase protein